MPLAPRIAPQARRTPFQPPAPAPAPVPVAAPKPKPPAQAQVQGEFGLGRGLVEHVYNRYMEAQDVVEKSGQGDWLPWEPTEEEAKAQFKKYGTSYAGLGAMAMNVGQWRPLDMPVGKGLAALGTSADFVLNLLPETTERVIGNYMLDPIRDELKVDTPDKERAFQYALGNTYSAFTDNADTLRRTYKDMLEAQESGSLDAITADTIRAKHSIWWAELAGQVVLDPLNLVTSGGKAIKAGMSAKAANKLYWTPLLKAGTSELADTAEVITKLKKSASVGAQFTDAEGITDKIMAALPRLKSSVAARTADHVDQVGLMFFGTEQRRTAGALMRRGLKPATPEFDAAFGPEYRQAIQVAANEWVKLASDNIDEVKAGAQALKSFGYGQIPTSEMGRLFGYTLKQIVGVSDTGIKKVVAPAAADVASLTGRVDEAVAGARKMLPPEIARQVDDALRNVAAGFTEADDLARLGKVEADAAALVPFLKKARKTAADPAAIDTAIDTLLTARKEVKALGKGTKVTEQVSEAGDLFKALRETVEGGETAEALAAKWTAKVAGVMEDMIETPAWEKGGPLAAVQAYHGWKPKREVESAFALMFMGLNPGFAARNMYNNWTMGVLGGWSPFSFGTAGLEYFPVVGAARGYSAIGAKSTSKLQVGHWLAEKGESAASESYSQQARWHFLGRAWKGALKEEVKLPVGVQPEIARRLEKAVAGLQYKGPEAIDDLEAELMLALKPAAGGSVPPVSGGRLLTDEWRVLDTAIETRLANTGDKLLDEVNKILTKADDVGEAKAQLNGLAAKYAEKLRQVAANTQNVGAVQGTLTGQAVKLMTASDQFKMTDIDTFAEMLGGIEASIRRSRAEAYATLLTAEPRNVWASKLVGAEKDFEAATKGLTLEQTVLHAEFMAGTIDAKTYTSKLLEKYQAAYRNLDANYKAIIDNVGRVFDVNMPLPPFEKASRPLLRRELAQEMYRQGYPSAVPKGFDEATTGLLGKGVTPTVFRGEAAGAAVPDIRFNRHVSKLLGRQIKNLNELTDAEMLKVINAGRAGRGLEEFKDARTLYDRAMQQYNYTKQGLPLEGLQALPVNTPWTTMPNGEKIFITMPDVKGEVPWEQFETFVRQRLNIVDPSPLGTEAIRSLRAAEHLIENGVPAVEVTGASLTDAAVFGARESTDALDSLIKTIDETLALPQRPIVTAADVDVAAQWTPYFEALRGAHSKTQLIATEVARRARDFALLDYRDRRVYDPFIKVIYPWGYWHTRNIPNFIAGAALNPAAVANYMKFKRNIREWNDKDPNIPAWAKDTITLHPYGFQGTIYADLEASFVPIQGMFETFNDPDREKDAFGKWIQELGKAGPAVHPVLPMAYAAERWMLWGDEEGARSAGYLSPLTKALSAATGVVVEPWLWVTNPMAEGGGREPGVGGSTYDLRKAARYLGYQAGQGEYRPEEAILGGATRQGEPFKESLRDVLEMRQLPVLASTVFGLRLTPRWDWEETVDQANAAWAQAKAAGSEEAKHRVLEDNPWLTVTWMSWDNELGRTSSLAYSVFDRMPPGGSARTKLLEQAGIPPLMVDMFYEGIGQEGNGLAAWQPQDIVRFQNGVLSLAEILQIPNRQTAREWREAKDASQKMREERDRLFPDFNDQAAEYHQIKAIDKDEAREYGKSSGFFNALQWQTEHMLDNPLLLKYYADPVDVDIAADNLVRDTIEARYPGFYKAQTEYYAIPEDDAALRRQYRVNHPELREGWKVQSAIEVEVRAQLKDERDLAATGAPAPGVVEYIVRGKPNLMQRTLLNVISDLEYEAERRPSAPEPKASKLTPEEAARFEASDNVYAAVYADDPGLVIKEKIYDKLKTDYGQQSADLYAKQVGLYDTWDEIKLLKIQSPVLLADMDAVDLEKAAKALARRQKDQLFPGIDETWAVYKSLPKGPERKAFWRDHPELKASMDWDYDATVDTNFTFLINQRDQTRQPTLPPAAPGGPAEFDIEKFKQLTGGING